MKSKKQLKQELHKLIDSIEDEHVLNVLNDDIVPYVIQNRAKEEDNEDLTEEQLKELEEKFKEMEAGEYATMADFRKAMGRWLIK
ncbi:MAG: hypothetical protein SFU87_11555 [Chitinophagaceae bacterium]|nr:hypothetical protein [Chitinophagaceae bacterium]